MENAVRQTYPEKSTLEELGLPVGTLLTLETRNPPRKHKIRLIGIEEGKGIIVSSPQKNGNTDYLEIGSLAKVKLLHTTSIVSFGCRVVSRENEPFPHVFLSYPSAVEIRRVRSSERIDTCIKANVDSEFNLHDNWPKFATVEDLSKSGARIRCGERLGEFGHKLLFQFELALPEMSRVVDLSAIIRNAHVEAQQPGEPHFVFGVQFLEMNDDARLAINNYIYEYR